MTSSHPHRIANHRVQVDDPVDVVRGEVHYAPVKSLWLTGMAIAAVVGGALTFTWAAFGVFLATTATVLLLGHSLGSHRKLIHDSFQCPTWLARVLVWLGVQAGLAGPLGLLRQHDLRDFAQRLPDCHDYLRHGRSFWRDGWWQLHCELRLHRPPQLTLEPRVAEDRFLRFLERTWMLQQVPVAIGLYALGGWGFVFWGTCARVTAGVTGHWLIGHFAHNQGQMHHEVQGAAVQGRNIRLASLVTMGGCWHNHHHAFPGSARLGLFAGEWDPGWWVLMAMHRAGLVWALRLPEDLPFRPELKALDGPARALRGSVVGGASARAPRLWQVVARCVARRVPGESVPVLVGPAVNLSPRATRWLVGTSTSFEFDAAAPRMRLRFGATQVPGLPALCIAVARRGGVARALALVAVPVAVAIESVRAPFQSA